MKRECLRRTKLKKNKQTKGGHQTQPAPHNQKTPHKQVSALNTSADFISIFQTTKLPPFFATLPSHSPPSPLIQQIFNAPWTSNVWMASIGLLISSSSPIAWDVKNWLVSCPAATRLLLEWKKSESSNLPNWGRKSHSVLLDAKDYGHSFSWSQLSKNMNRGGQNYPWGSIVMAIIKCQIKREKQGKGKTNRNEDHWVRT